MKVVCREQPTPGSWTGTIAVRGRCLVRLRRALRAAGDDDSVEYGHGGPGRTGRPPTTGLRRAATPANVVALSLSNLRGLSSEAVNAGGRVTVNLATGAVTSLVQLLPR